MSGLIVSYRYKEHNIVQYFENEEELDKFINAHPGIEIISVKPKEITKKIWTGPEGKIHVEYHDSTGKLVDPDLLDQVNEILVGKYGIRYEDLVNIILSSNSQPEALQKLRMKLKGSINYDPSLYELEYLFNQLYDAIEHPSITDAQIKLEKTLHSFVIKNSPHTIVHKSEQPLPVPNPKAEILTKLPSGNGAANGSLADKTKPFIVGILVVLLGYFLYRWLK